MAWNDIADWAIESIIKDIECGIVDPEMKEYIFLVRDGRNLAVNETNEDRARYVLESRHHKIIELKDVTRPTFNGMTYKEIIAEAKKRGIR